MATYIQIYNFKNESSPASLNLRCRVTVAIATGALTVLSEGVGVNNHTNRLVWAKTALKDAEGMATQMMWAVISDATVQASGAAITDAQLQTVINGLIDTFAG